jgi:multisubunit Na+/H+ antiporter MnhC subunit
VGEVDLFETGCPTCGYSAEAVGKPHVPRKKERHHEKLVDPLPLWVYIVTLVIFLGVSVILFLITR